MIKQQCNTHKIYKYYFFLLHMRVCVLDKINENKDLNSIKAMSLSHLKGFHDIDIHSNSKG